MKFEEFKKNLQDLDEDNEEYIKFKRSFDNYEKIIIIGNGGSNAIASHISQDYTKKNNKMAFTFSDPSRLTCYINDYGRDDAYAKFLQQFSDNQTLVILISSSGNSMNVINCAQFCKKENIYFGILTGFSANNSLRNQFSMHAKFDYHVNSDDYGVVECLHQVFLHGVS